jgi:hypothetical protein
VHIDWNREATTFVTASSTPSAYTYRPSAAAEAVAAGVTMRDALAGRGLGHTPRELIETVSAQQDLKDAQAEARQRAAYYRWQVELSADMSVDMSAPTPAEKVELEATTARAARNAEVRRTGRLRPAQDQGAAGARSAHRSAVQVGGSASQRRFLMAELRDANEVYAEQVAQAAAAVAPAVNTNDGNQAQVQAWMDGRLDADALHAGLSGTDDLDGGPELHA